MKHTNSPRIALVLALAALSPGALTGCNSGGGGPDSQVIDAGGSPDIQYADTQPGADAADAAIPDATSTPDSSADGATDAGSDAARTDAGAWVDGCFVGRPVEMVEFLNRCTTAQTATHTMSAPLLLADGGVPPLP